MTVMSCEFESHSLHQSSLKISGNNYLRGINENVSLRALRQFWCEPRAEGKFTFTMPRRSPKPPQIKISREIFICGNSSVGRARPCQGRGREFESRLPLHSKTKQLKSRLLFLYVTE